MFILSTDMGPNNLEKEKLQSLMKKPLTLKVN